MFEDGGSWFFYTREQTMEGPFINLEQANIGLANYINRVTAVLMADNFALTQAS